MSLKGRQRVVVYECLLNRGNSREEINRYQKLEIVAAYRKYISVLSSERKCFL